MILIFIFAPVFILLSCSDNDEQRTESEHQGAYEMMELRYLGSPSNITAAEVAEDLGYLAPVKLKWIGNSTSGPESIQAVATGSTDFGSAFNGAIVKLIAAKAPIQAVISSGGIDTNTWNGYYPYSDTSVKSPLICCLQASFGH
jgi:ABC-type nitrate/sulfonate/bicarbonate transport system substrate-binding protein